MVTDQFPLEITFEKAYLKGEKVFFLEKESEKNQTEGSFYFSEKTFFFCFMKTIGLDFFFF